MEPKARLDFDTRIQLPSHALFVGATQSGKTRLCLHLLTNPQLFHPKPKRILFHYDQYQESYKNASTFLAKQGIELLLFKGCADVNLDTMEKLPGQTILLIDDFSEETSSSKEIARIATNGRHKNISLWLVWHSLYTKHPASKLITQNIRWFFFLPSVRLESQLRTFGNQLGMKSRLLWAYNQIQDDFSRPHRYLLADLGPQTPNVLRLRSNIEDSDKQFCYM
jgi:hypothetical protein